ncbi:MAG TPA: M48 family metallopeptidase [Verrucomicrobiae bacterium]|nr:M48 family metallopeptidase [Verrucomicrobiae bacterium]
MKRWLVLLALLIAAGAALYYSQRHKTETRVGPEGALNALADAQRELSRVPAGLARLSDEEEIRIGDTMATDAAAAMRTGWNERTDAAIERYVNVVGRHVAVGAQRKLDYRFHYLPDANFVNAFALPGGHVFIGKGLMLLMDTEDELASILGHEVEHVDRYHCNERVAVEARLRGMPLSGLVQLPVALFVAGYNKDQELEADRDGTYLAVLAGYSPQGAVRMFQAFERLHQQYLSKPSSPDQEASQVMVQSIAGYFRSHPLPQERERQIRQLIAEKKWPEKKERALQIQLSEAKTG